MAQLGNSVMVGGAVIVDTYRHIILNQFEESGRYFIDLAEILGSKKTVRSPEGNNFLDISKQEILITVDALSLPDLEATLINKKRS